MVCANNQRDYLILQIKIHGKQTGLGKSRKRGELDNETEN